VDAIVSLCRLGTEELLSGEDRNHVEVALLDNPDRAKNPNLDAVLADAADVVAELRAEGRTVLLHCVQAVSRTPTVAVLYAMRHRGIPAEQALAAVIDALPYADPNPEFRAAIQRFAR
jgi:protein-tyrosine phosphatase